MAEKRNQEVRAQFWRRVVAYLIDMLIVSVVVLLPFTGSLDPFDEKSTVAKIYSLVTSQVEFSWKMFFTGLAVAVLIILYFALFEFELRQTPGKMAMRIEVRSTSGPLTFARALLRNWTKFSTGLLFLDTVYMFVSKTRLRCFEWLSRTEVVLRRDQRMVMRR